MNTARESIEGKLTPYQSMAIDTVIKEVCTQFNVTEEQLKSKSRERPLVEYRQLALYVCWGLHLGTQKGIAGKFGGRQHSTLIHAIDTIDDIISIDKKGHYSSMVKGLVSQCEQLIEPMQASKSVEINVNNIAQL